MAAGQKAPQKRGPRIEPNRLALIVLDAEIYGATKAAKKHGVCLDTIRSYRGRLLTNVEALAIYRRKKETIEAHWKDARINFLLQAVARLEELLPRMGADQVRDIVGAIKILGELHTTQRALEDGLTDGHDTGTQPGSDAQVPAPDDAGSESAAPVH